MLRCQRGDTGSSPVVRTNSLPSADQNTALRTRLSRVRLFPGAPIYAEIIRIKGARETHSGSDCEIRRPPVIGSIQHPRPSGWHRLMSAKHSECGSIPQPWSGGEVAMARHHVCTVALAGSNPVASTILGGVAQADRTDDCGQPAGERAPREVQGMGGVASPFVPAAIAQTPVGIRPPPPIFGPSKECERWPPKPAVAGSSPAGSTISHRWQIGTMRRSSKPD